MFCRVSDTWCFRSRTYVLVTYFKTIVHTNFQLPDFPLNLAHSSQFTIPLPIAAGYPLSVHLYDNKTPPQVLGTPQKVVNLVISCPSR